MALEPIQIFPDLWQFTDTCNVYLLKHGDEAVAIDFGSGAWLQHLPGLGIRRLAHVFLTHHHPDQCAGLQAQSPWPFDIHAPSGEERFFDPEQVARGDFDARYKGCPDTYAVLPGGIPNARYDMAGFGDFFWGAERIRFLLTPGHSANACSIIVDHAGRQVVFCGDAAHAGATIWQPYHLEWDHWTGGGALAAWEGIVRLYGVAIDALCPAHGPVVTDRPRDLLKRLARKLLTLYHSKGQISPGEPDAYLTPEIMPCGAQRLLPHLYHFGVNGYLLRSEDGQGMVIDPFSEDMPALEALLGELGDVRPTVATATHYHADHCDGIRYLRERHGCCAVLHPWVAEPLGEAAHAHVPWLPREPIVPDELWPARGEWEWRGYRFTVAPWPGQTRWHCVFMTRVDGMAVAFGGDSFQPASRWNGTGGYCAYNGSRFEDGFVASAQLIMSWKPDIVVCGHDTFYTYNASKFRKIIRWARAAQSAVTDLCPSGNLEQDYYGVSQAAAAFFWAAAR